MGAFITEEQLRHRDLSYMTIKQNNNNKKTKRIAQRTVATVFSD